MTDVDDSGTNCQVRRHWQVTSSDEKMRTTVISHSKGHQRNLDIRLKNLWWNTRKRRMRKKPLTISSTNLADVISCFLIVALLAAEVVIGVVGEKPRHKTAYACEGENLHLFCEGSGLVIHVIRANYGRFSITICNSHGRADMPVNCMSASSLRIMHARCNKKRQCDIPANSTVFGDPCAGTEKYLVAHYRCLPADGPTEGNLRPDPRNEETNGTPFFNQPAVVHQKEPGVSTSTEPTYSTVFIPKPPPPLKLPSTPPPPPPPLVLITRRPTTALTTRTTTTTTVRTTTVTSSIEILEDEEEREFEGDNRIPLKGASPDERRRIDAYDVHRPGVADVLDTQTSTTSRSLPTSTVSANEDDLEMKVAKRHRTCPTVVDKRGLVWPATSGGRVASVACPSYSTPGVARWHCSSTVHKDKDGTAKVDIRWEDGHPDVSECRTKWLEEMFQKVKAGAFGNSDPPSGSDPSEIVRTMAGEIRRSARSMFGGDLETLAKIWQVMAMQVEEMDPEIMGRTESEDTARHLLAVGGQVLSSAQAQAWQDLGKSKKRPFAASDVLASFERVMLAVADKHGSHAGMVLDGDSIDAAAYKFPENSGEVLDVIQFPSEEDLRGFGWSKMAVSVAFDPHSVAQYGATSVVFAVYRDFGAILGDGDDFDDNHDAVRRFNGDFRLKRKVLNSEVMSINVGSRLHPTNLTRPVNMTFANLRVENVSEPTCVFWDYKSSGWMTEGCHLKSHNRTHTECQCDHLTHFAVLVDINGIELPAEHWIALTVITCVGCVISIICLGVAVVTFTLVTSLKGDRTTIHKNLCACLLIAETIFLLGIEATNNRIACGVVAGLLHYFFLAAFCWMFFEGFQIYVLLVEVFQSERARLKIYYWLSYGLPLIVVAVSAAVDLESYGTEKFCWLRVDNYFILSFVAPVGFILMCNMAFLGMALYVVCRHVSIMPGPKEQARLAAYGEGEERERESALKNKLPKFVKRLQGAFAIVVLLGLTWTFGFLYISESTVVMAYVFSILNSFQGLLIFVFTCICNEKVKEAYVRFFCGADSSRNGRRCWPFCCCCPNTSSSSMSNTMSGNAAHNHLQKLDHFNREDIQFHQQLQPRFSGDPADYGGVDLGRRFPSSREDNNQRRGKVGSPVKFINSACKRRDQQVDADEEFFGSGGPGMHMMSRISRPGSTKSTRLGSFSSDAISNSTTGVAVSSSGCSNAQLLCSSLDVLSDTAAAPSGFYQSATSACAKHSLKRHSQPFQQRFTGEKMLLGSSRAKNQLDQLRRNTMLELSNDGLSGAGFYFPVAPVASPNHGKSTLKRTSSQIGTTEVYSLTSAPSPSIYHNSKTIAYANRGLGGNPRAIRPPSSCSTSSNGKLSPLLSRHGSSGSPGCGRGAMTFTKEQQGRLRALTTSLSSGIGKALISGGPVSGKTHPVLKEFQDIVMMANELAADGSPYHHRQGFVQNSPHLRLHHQHHYSHQQTPVGNSARPSSALRYQQHQPGQECYHHRNQSPAVMSRVDSSQNVYAEIEDIHYHQPVSSGVMSGSVSVVPSFAV